MKYVCARYEPKDGKHFVRFEMDGSVRFIGFGLKVDALGFMRQLEVYCLLSNDIVGLPKSA